MLRLLCLNDRGALGQEGWLGEYRSPQIASARGNDAAGVCANVAIDTPDLTRLQIAYDEGLLERCVDCLDAMAITGVHHKNVFGMRGLMRGKQMFAAVGETEIIVKLTPAEFARAREKGIERFMPGGEPLGNWVVIPDDVVADDPDLRDWLHAGLRGIG